MFIFIDESGLTDVKSKQRYLVVAFAIMKNRAFAEELIFDIKDKCRVKGKPVKKKEIHFHDLEPLQKEVAVQTLNSRYRNFYICFVDLEKTHASMVTGSHEQEIQTKMIHSVLQSLDSNELRRQEKIEVIMDNKLSDQFQKSIEHELQTHVGTKKGIKVRPKNSGKERGIQVADIIAGAFRAKLMKKSDLFNVDYNRVYQITISDKGDTERRNYE